MEIAGKLERLDFVDLLRMLAVSGKSGKLTLSEYSDQGVIVFRQGKIIYAASGAARETLGNILLWKELIDEDQLKKGLEAQQDAKEERRLGAILVDLGYIDQAVLEEVISNQIEKVIKEFLEWHTGFFRFEEFELPDRGEVEVDARLLHGRPGDQLLEDGLTPGQVLLELGHDKAVVEAAVSHATGPEGGRFESLKSIMVEFHSPAFTGEGTLMILNYAQRLVSRGVLFAISGIGATGLGQFGVEPPEDAPPDFIRQLALPGDQRSIVTDALGRRNVFLGELERTPTNELLIRRLGGEWPSQVVAAPLIVGGRVQLVFYGDNLPDDRPIGSVDELEVVMIHAALAMEKSLLAKKVEHLEDLQRRTEPG